MVGITSIDAEGLRFWMAKPVDMAGRFPEIQSLRNDFYSETFKDHRSKEEIEHYVGRLTRSLWSHPEGAARAGAERVNSRAVAALDNRSGKIVALMHGVEEVSSRLPGALGALERKAKLRLPGARFEGKRYLAFNEYVHEGKHQHIIPTLGALMLDGMSDNQKASWYPYDEEWDLQADLEDWGFEPDHYPDDYPDPQERGRIAVEEVLTFGPETPAAQQERWTVRIGDMRRAIFTQPGVEEVVHDLRTPPWAK